MPPLGRDTATETQLLPSGDAQLSPKADKETAGCPVRGFCDRKGGGAEGPSSLEAQLEAMWVDFFYYQFLFTVQ